MPTSCYNLLYLAQLDDASSLSFLMLFNSYVVSLLLVLGFNVLALLVLGKCLLTHIKRMSFEKTRAALKYHVGANNESTQATAYTSTSDL